MQDPGDEVSSTKNASDVFVAALLAEGATAVFGNPGTTELPVMEALAAAGAPDFYLGLQEIVCLGMADGYAQATGRPAVVNLHSSPGLGNAMGNLYNAWRTGTPLVVTVGQQDTRFNLEEPLLYSDIVQAASQYTKWAWEVRSADDVPAAVRRAYKIASEAPTGPVLLSLPMDIMADPTDRGPVPVSAVRSIPLPTPADLDEISRLVGESERPVIIAGDSVDREAAQEDLASLAEHLGARVWAEPMAQRMPMDPEHPLFAGFLPPFGPLVKGALADADLVVMLGCEAFLLYPPYAPGAPFPDSAKLVHAHGNPREIAKNWPVQASAVGGMAEVAEGIRVRTAAHPERTASLRAAHTASAAKSAAKLDELRAKNPSHVAVVADALSAVWAGRPLVDEAVSATGPLQRAFATAAPSERYGHRAGGLGWGLPAALGVSLARPGERTIALLGDGASMYAIQGLWTAARHSLSLTVVILDNGGYEIIRAGLRRQGGRAAAEGHYLGTDLAEPGMDWAALAAGMGLSYAKAETAADIAEAARSLEDAGGPGLLHVVVTTKFTLP